jgi:hypothetical protein
MIADLDAYLAAKGPCFVDLIGRAADATESYGAQPEAQGRRRDSVPDETLGNMRMYRRGQLASRGFWAATCYTVCHGRRLGG